MSLSVSLRGMGFAFAFLPLFLFGCSSRSGKEPIVVGHISPLTGPESAVGEHGRQGILLAVEETNQDDKLIGVQKVAVRHVNSGGEEATALAEATRLITINKAAGLITFSAAASVDLLVRTVDSYAVPLVVCNPVAVPGSDSPLSLCLVPKQQGLLLARFALGDLKAKKAAVILDNRVALPSAVASAFALQWPKDEGHRLDQWTFEKTDKFAELADRLHKSNPEVILFAGQSGDVGDIRAALDKTGIHVPFLFAGEETTFAKVMANREVSQGVYVLTSYVSGVETTDEGKAFIKKYQDRFKEAPDLHAVLAYEAATMLFDAMRKVGKPDPAAVKKALGELDTFTGVTGPILFKDRATLRPAFLAQVETGQLKVVRRFKADEE